MEEGRARVQQHVYGLWLMRGLSLMYFFSSLCKRGAVSAVVNGWRALHTGHVCVQGASEKLYNGIVFTDFFSLYSYKVMSTSELTCVLLTKMTLLAPALHLISFLGKGGKMVSGLVA